MLLLFAACSGGDGGEGFCYGYVERVADAMLGSSNNSINGHRACIPAAVTVGELKDIVVQYLYRNVAQRHLLAGGLVAEALEQRFPCE